MQKIILFLVFMTSLSLAEDKADTDTAQADNQVMVIADKVDIEDSSAVSVYSGNARASRGETYIEADVIEIIHPNQEPKSLHITGSPAFINYVGEDKEDKIEASANSINYDIETEILILQGAAKVINGQNQIAAEYIKVNKKTGELHATAAEKSQVQTIFEIK